MWIVCRAWRVVAMKWCYLARASKLSEEKTMDNRSQTEKPNPSQSGQRDNEPNKQSGQIDQRQSGSSPQPPKKDVQNNEQQEREKTGTR
jgi:hypothetical protein